MAITAYTLANKAHFADMQDGDIAGDINDVLVLDSVEKTGMLYRSGVLVGTSFYFTSAQAAALVTAGWLTANTTFSGVPNGKGTYTGYTAVTGWTAASKLGFTSTTTATLLQVSQVLGALISDLQAAGIIGV